MQEKKTPYLTHDIFDDESLLRCDVSGHEVERQLLHDGRHVVRSLVPAVARPVAQRPASRHWNRTRQVGKARASSTAFSCLNLCTFGCRSTRVKCERKLTTADGDVAALTRRRVALHAELLPPEGHTTPRLHGTAVDVTHELQQRL